MLALATAIVASGRPIAWSRWISWNDIFMLLQKVLMAVSDRNAKALLRLYRNMQSRVCALVCLPFRPYTHLCF